MLTGHHHANPLIVSRLCRYYSRSGGPSTNTTVQTMRGSGTIVIVSCRVRFVLFQAVLVPAHRVNAKWIVLMPNGHNNGCRVTSLQFF